MGLPLSFCRAVSVICISRAARQAEFPARFQMIAAMNPCPCGYLGDPAARCRCTVDQIQRYRARISGPLMDRLDMHVEVPRIPTSDLQVSAPAESSSTIRSRVRKARDVQWQRQGKCNARLQAAEIDRWCVLDSDSQVLMARAMQKLALLARAYHRILKVARSIADLDGHEFIIQSHVSEAIALRRLDRNSRGAST